MNDPVDRQNLKITGQHRAITGQHIAVQNDVTVIITRFAPSAHIEWTISGAVQPPIKHLYGYRLEPSEIGTLVTSYYDWSQIDEQYRDKGIFPVIPEAALRATLGILARTVQ